MGAQLLAAGGGFYPHRSERVGLDLGVLLRFGSVFLSFPFLLISSCRAVPSSNGNFVQIDERQKSWQFCLLHFDESLNFECICDELNRSQSCAVLEGPAHGEELGKKAEQTFSCSICYMEEFKWNKTRFPLLLQKAEEHKWC